MKEPLTPQKIQRALKSGELSKTYYPEFMPIAFENIAGCYFRMKFYTEAEKNFNLASKYHLTGKKQKFKYLSRIRMSDLQNRLKSILLTGLKKGWHYFVWTCKIIIPVSLLITFLQFLRKGIDPQVKLH